MANIRSIISSFLLIMQTNDAILARIEFMVVFNSILLLILFIFDTYRRRSRIPLVKYIHLAADAASQSMILHTLGLMQSAPLRNSVFEVWAILLAALRFSMNYITVYGLQEQGQIQWTAEFGAALLSFTWAGELNGTRGSKTSVWVLWALQPLRVFYMLLAYTWARKSYWQGRSSVLLADYMEAENGSKDPEESSNKNESWNNSESKPKGNNPDDYRGMDPRSDSRVSNQRGKPPYTVGEGEPETTHMVITKTKKVNSKTNSQRIIEIEEVSQKTDYQEPSNYNPYVKPQWSRGEANVRTNVEVPSSTGVYDPSSMRGYRYLIQGEIWQEVEAKKLEDKLQLRITHEEKLITLDKVWQCKGKLLGEWGDKDGQLKDLCLSFALYRLLRCRFDKYPLPDASIRKTRTLLLDGILSRTKNDERAKTVNKGPEELQEGTIKENEGIEKQQGGTKEGNKSPEKQGSDNDQHGVADELNRDEKQPYINCQTGGTGEPYRETKQLEQDGIIEVQPEDEKQPVVHALSQNGSTKELDRDTDLPDGGVQDKQGSVKEHDSVIEKQKDGSNAEKNEDEVKEEVADRVFEITGTELSFINNYMYSRFPVIFWRGKGLIVSIFLYITVVACTCWVGISIVQVYTPPEGDFTHVIHGYNIDVFITWGILLFIVFKETWEILIYLFSDWTKVVLISMYVERACMRNWLMENLIWLLCKCSMVGRWHGKIDQYNFLEAYDYRPKLFKLVYYLSLGSVPKARDGVESKSQIVLPKEVKKAIVKSISSVLKEELKMDRLPGRMPLILKRNDLSEIFQMHGLHELQTCSQIILAWHIATSLCEIELCQHYNVYLADSELPSLWSSQNCRSSEPFLVKKERLGKDLRRNFIIANSLSRYCAHLLIKQPDLLPDHIFITEDIFQQAMKEACNILKGCDTLQTIYKRLMKEGGEEIKSENEKTIMRLSARLGKILTETLDEEARWKALACVWADLLVYMAPNSNVKAHEECLATGGELITHVWILLYHAGILENGLVDHGEDNDIENPEVL